ncbi:hypothetical protein BKA70DRAFT_1444997 [Coprinopsis sp. MPI-PUGE-AT-0042]|nr:hypothetical protein BKA70DRAFT_1444997 [Coprinopsis sp. MPI-PUGE-AT-0042]
MASYIQQPNLIDVVPPELFPLIVAHIPLYSVASTLLSLALTNRRSYSIIVPEFLFQHVVLKGREDTMRTLNFLLLSPGISSLVQGLHISALFEVFPWIYDCKFPQTLDTLFKSGHLKNLKMLELHVGWRNWEDIFGGMKGWPMDRLKGLMFWHNLKSYCPQLEHISCGHLDRKTRLDCPHPSWENLNNGWSDPHVLTLGYEGMKSISAKLSHSSFMSGVYHREYIAIEYLLLRPLAASAPSLRKLELSWRRHRLKLASPRIWELFDIDFPVLESLTFIARPNTQTHRDQAKARAFWSRHAGLEYVWVEDVTPTGPWIVWFDDLESGAGKGRILPNLRHLTASRAHLGLGRILTHHIQVRYQDARCLSPILRQLSSLAVLDSINAQVPYLLRAILPQGLPRLKSLNIIQSPRSSRAAYDAGFESHTSDDLRWYETCKGGVHLLPNDQPQDIGVIVGPGGVGAYLKSIVEACPGLIELAIQSGEEDPPHDLDLAWPGIYTLVAHELAKLPNLERFFVQGDMRDYSAGEHFFNDRAWTETAKKLGETCHSLQSFGTIQTTDDPGKCFVAKISRSEQGGVLTVRLGYDAGMVISKQDELEAFMWTPDRYSRLERDQDQGPGEWM